MSRQQYSGHAVIAGSTRHHGLNLGVAEVCVCLGSCLCAAAKLHLLSAHDSDSERIRWACGQLTVCMMCGWLLACCWLLSALHSSAGCLHVVCCGSSSSPGVVVCSWFVVVVVGVVVIVVVVVGFWSRVYCSRHCLRNAQIVARWTHTHTLTHPHTQCAHLQVGPQRRPRLPEHWFTKRLSWAASNLQANIAGTQTMTQHKN